MGRSGVGRQVHLAGVTKRFGNAVAVNDINLAITAGEFLALLGSSGSGKTTTLMMIAGLEQPDAGAIVIGETEVTAIPPHKRNLGVVFQSYALFPHMTVEENINFPLKMHGVSRSERRRRVAEAADLVHLAGMETRLPRQLSGGQQQRVALARALVLEPAVLLMDEPLGALDRKLREEMQGEIRQLQQRIGITTLYVTHDQEEAMAMSDRVAVMNMGRIEQVGTPREIYDAPANRFVAEFVGESNFFGGRAEGSEGGWALVGCPEGKIRARSAELIDLGAMVQVAVRPERIRLERVNGRRESRPNRCSGLVARIAFIGSMWRVDVTLDSGALARVTMPHKGESLSPPPAGTRVWLEWNAEDAAVVGRAHPFVESPTRHEQAVLTEKPTRQGEPAPGRVSHADLEPPRKGDS